MYMLCKCVNTVFLRCRCHGSLGPRPKTNPSADRFQYRERYTRRMKSGDETNVTATIFFATSFGVTTIRGWHLFLWKARRHQRRLDKVRMCMSDTVTTVRRCQE